MKEMRVAVCNLRYLSSSAVMYRSEHGYLPVVGKSWRRLEFQVFWSI